jgi:hypothetical protein
VSSSATADLWAAIAATAAAESPLWAGALREDGEREAEPVFSPLTDEPYALAVETIYEGYLTHYGRPRLFAPADRDTALLLGDYLYAQGIVHLAATGSVEAVAEMAELISLCAHLRGQGSPGDGEAWVSTVSGLGGRDASDGEETARALAAHARRVG